MVRSLTAVLMVLAVLSAATPSPLGATGVMDKAKQLTAPLDLNSASLDDLKKLPGLKDADAKKISDGRPYSKTSDLVDRKILSPEVFDAVKSLVTVKP
jgi:competence protein ComEA